MRARQQQLKSNSTKCSEWYDMTFPVFMQPCNDSLFAFACYVAWINCNLYICVERDCIKLNAFAIIPLYDSGVFLEKKNHSNYYYPKDIDRKSRNIRASDFCVSVKIRRRREKKLITSIFFPRCFINHSNKSD